MKQFLRNWWLIPLALAAIIWQADASNLWRYPKDARIILCHSNSQQTHTGDTNEWTAATCTIPGGLPGIHGVIRTWSVWSFSGANGTRTERIRLGGASGTIFMASGLGTTINSLYSVHEIRNQASQSVQKAMSGSTPAGSTVAITTGAVNTANSQDLVLTAQLANGSDTVNLEGYTVEVIPMSAAL